jgi:hypothetical protein
VPTAPRLALEYKRGARQAHRTHLSFIEAGPRGA